MPLLTAVFVVLGALVGVARGGRVYRIAENIPRAWPLLPFGVALVLQSGHPGLPGARWFHLAGYGYLLLFALTNLRNTFAAVILAIGVLANAGVIAANERMPYDQSAAVSVGMYDSASDLHADHPTREWETADTRLAQLGRRYAVEPTKEVVSLGDLAVCLAAAWFAMYVLIPSRRLSRLRPVEYRTSSEARAARRRSARRSRRANSALTPLDPGDIAYSQADIATNRDTLAPGVPPGWEIDDSAFAPHANEHDTSEPAQHRRADEQFGHSQPAAPVPAAPWSTGPEHPPEAEQIGRDPWAPH